MVPREMEVDSDSGSVSLVASDLPKHLELLTETSKLIPAVEASVRKVRDAMLSEEEDGVVSTEAGLSLLELKNHLMLQYLSDLAYVQLLKASGGKLSGDAAVDRLVTARTVLEKIRPLESKLKHLVDKALKAAESGMVDEDDPMNARANPAALMSKFGDDESEEDESDGEEEGAGGGGVKKEKDGKYVAPKHIPAYFADPGDADSRSEETAAKEKKKLLSKSLIDDLRQQHLDTPEEVHAHEDVLKKRKIEAMRARTDYEERYMMRLPLTKKQKHSRRQMGSTIGTIANEVTQFGTSYFSEGADGKKRKKRRASQGGKKKKKFRK